MKLIARIPVLAFAAALSTGCVTPQKKEDDKGKQAQAVVRDLSVKSANRPTGAPTAALSNDFTPGKSTGDITDAILRDDPERVRALQAAGQFIGSDHVVLATKLARVATVPVLMELTHYDTKANACKLLDNLIGPSARPAPEAISRSSKLNPEAQRLQNATSEAYRTATKQRIGLLEKLDAMGAPIARCDFNYDSLAENRFGTGEVIQALHRLTQRSTQGSLLKPFAALRRTNAWESAWPLPLADNLRALLKADASVAGLTLDKVLDAVPWDVERDTEGLSTLGEMVGVLVEAGLKPNTADLQRLQSINTKRTAMNAKVLAALQTRLPALKDMQGAMAKSDQLKAVLDYYWTTGDSDDLYVRNSERAAWMVRQGHSLVNSSGEPSCWVTAQTSLARGMLPVVAAFFDTPPADHSGCVGYLRQAPPAGLLEQMANLGGLDKDGRRCNEFVCRHAGTNAQALVDLFLKNGYPHPVAPSAASHLLQSLYFMDRSAIAARLIDSNMLDPVPAMKNVNLKEDLVSWVANKSGDKKNAVMAAWSDERKRIDDEQRAQARQTEDRRASAERDYQNRVHSARAAVKSIAAGDTLFWEWKQGNFLKIEAEQVSGARVQARIVEYCHHVNGDRFGGEKWCRTDWGPHEQYPLTTMRWFNRGELLGWQP